eukprot:6059253-Prorocentrum_lima.AAC.1
MITAFEAKSSHVAGEYFVFGLEVDGAVGHSDKLCRWVTFRPIQVPISVGFRDGKGFQSIDMP